MLTLSVYLFIDILIIFCGALFGMGIGSDFYLSKITGMGGEKKVNHSRI